MSSPFTIQPATPTDSPALTRVFLAAFSDDFNVTLFPRTPDVTEWWTATFARDIRNAKPNEPVLKVVDNASQVVAFAKWKFPPSSSTTTTTTENQGRERVNEEDEVKWPPSCDRVLCDRFFGAMERMRREVMHGRSHCYLDMLGTDPAYHGRGIGSRLLTWGLAQADKLGMETFLTATPAGKPLYEKFGFREVAAEEILGGYVNTYMVRPAGGHV